MSVNVNGRTNQIYAGNEFVQNAKAGSSPEQEPAAKASDTQPPKDDQAVSLSISQDAFDSWRTKLRENSTSSDGKVLENKHEFIKQASNSIFANQYENELTKKADELTGSHGDGTYTLSNKIEDYVKAYGSLYDEIVQGYQNGTRERYVEDENSKTGFRRMTMEEELSSLDKAFQKTADREQLLAENQKKAAAAFKNTAEKLAKYKGVKTSFADAYQKLDEKGVVSADHISQKMTSAAQAWKNAYQTSGSKDYGIEIALSILKSNGQ